MPISWNNVAASFVDQLSSSERARIEHAVQEVPREWERAVAAGRVVRLAPVSDQDRDSPVYVLRVGDKFRVFFRRPALDHLAVVDVVRRSQLDWFASESAGQARR
jgi:hypothetical protein